MASKGLVLPKEPKSACFGRRFKERRRLCSKIELHRSRRTRLRLPRESEYPADLNPGVESLRIPADARFQHVSKASRLASSAAARPEASRDDLPTVSKARRLTSSAATRPEASRDGLPTVSKASPTYLFSCDAPRSKPGRLAYRK
jgi:hypothetical protein